MHDAMVEAAAYVLTARPHRGQAAFRRLLDKPDKATEVYQGTDEPFLRNLDDFAHIPGSPAAYWLSSELLEIFKSPPADRRGKRCRAGRSADIRRLPVRAALVGSPMRKRLAVDGVGCHLQKAASTRPTAQTSI